jgi:hypothetical protein
VIECDGVEFLYKDYDEALGYQTYKNAKIIEYVEKE